MNNKQRPVLVIGASGSIGEAIALRLRRDGRPLALTHSPRGKPAATLPNDVATRWYSLEVRDSTAVAAVVAQATADFGATPDLVYCAGITGDRAMPRITDELWASVLETNLYGAFYAVRALLSGLMTAGNGRIVLLGSIAATKGNPGKLSYSASKGALEAMARQIAVELGRFKVTCNVVSPGLIKGRMADEVPADLVDRVLKGTPLRQIGEPADVGNLVAMLMGEEGRHITGQTLQIDGGLTAT